MSKPLLSTEDLYRPFTRVCSTCRLPGVTTTSHLTSTSSRKGLPKDLSSDKTMWERTAALEPRSKKQRCYFGDSHYRGQRSDYITLVIQSNRELKTMINNIKIDYWMQERFCFSNMKIFCISLVRVYLKNSKNIFWSIIFQSESVLGKSSFRSSIPLFIPRTLKKPVIWCINDIKNPNYSNVYQISLTGSSSIRNFQKTFEAKLGSYEPSFSFKIVCIDWACEH